MIQVRTKHSHQNTYLRSINLTSQCKKHTHKVHIFFIYYLSLFSHTYFIF